MDVEVRPVVDDEFEDLLRVDQVAFGGPPMEPEEMAGLRKGIELDRSRTSDEADLALAVEDLGALYLGGVAASTQCRGGRRDPSRIAAGRRHVDLDTGTVQPHRLLTLGPRPWVPALVRLNGRRRRASFRGSRAGR